MAGQTPRSARRRRWLWSDPERDGAVLKFFADQGGVPVPGAPPSAARFLELAGAAGCVLSIGLPPGLPMPPMVGFPHLRTEEAFHQYPYLRPPRSELSESLRAGVSGSLGSEASEERLDAIAAEDACGRLRSGEISEDEGGGDGTTTPAPSSTPSDEPRSVPAARPSAGRRVKRVEHMKLVANGALLDAAPGGNERGTVAKEEREGEGEAPERGQLADTPVGVPPPNPMRSDPKVGGQMARSEEGEERNAQTSECEQLVDTPGVVAPTGPTCSESKEGDRVAGSEGHSGSPEVGELGTTADQPKSPASPAGSEGKDGEHMAGSEGRPGFAEVAEMGASGEQNKSPTNPASSESKGGDQTAENDRPGCLEAEELGSTGEQLKSPGAQESDESEGMPASPHAVPVDGRPESSAEGMQAQATGEHSEAPQNGAQAAAENGKMSPNAVPKNKKEASKKEASSQKGRTRGGDGQERNWQVGNGQMGESGGKRDRKKGKRRSRRGYREERVQRGDGGHKVGATPHSADGGGRQEGAGERNRQQSVAGSSNGSPIPPQRADGALREERNGECMRPQVGSGSFSFAPVSAHGQEGNGPGGGHQDNATGWTVVERRTPRGKRAGQPQNDALTPRGGRHETRRQSFDATAKSGMPPRPSPRTPRQDGRMEHGGMLSGAYQQAGSHARVGSWERQPFPNDVWKRSSSSPQGVPAGHRQDDRWEKNSNRSQDGAFDRGRRSPYAPSPWQRQAGHMDGRQHCDAPQVVGGQSPYGASPHQRQEWRWEKKQQHGDASAYGRQSTHTHSQGMQSPYATSPSTQWPSLPSQGGQFPYQGRQSHYATSPGSQWPGLPSPGGQSPYHASPGKQWPYSPSPSRQPQYPSGQAGQSPYPHLQAGQSPYPPSHGKAAQDARSTDQHPQEDGWQSARRRKRGNRGFDGSQFRGREETERRVVAPPEHTWPRYSTGGHRSRQEERAKTGGRPETEAHRKHRERLASGLA